MDKVLSELERIMKNPTMDVPGVEFLGFLLKDMFMDPDDVPCANYVITISSLQEYKETKNIQCLSLRKLRVKNRIIVSERGAEYFDMFLSTRLDVDLEEKLIECFNEKRLIPMFIKVKEEK